MPEASAHWIAVGRCAGVDWLLVPQITYLRQRDGSEMSVRDAASVTMDLFLVNVGEASPGRAFPFRGNAALAYREHPSTRASSCAGEPNG